MKLCPQCDFIYEDEQGFCDMDGKELVFSLVPAESQANIAASLTPTPGLPTAPPQRGLAAAIVVVVVLAALVIALYLVRKHQTRSGAATETSTQLPDRSAGESAAQSNSETTSTQPAATQTIGSSEVSAESSPAEGDDDSLTDSSSQSEASRTALAHTRLAAGSVSAGASSGNNRTSVIVRLNNGAVIKADEAWEKREGVWYRQAGMVTFVKRSQVKSIERLAAPAPSKSVARTADDKSTKTASTQNQLRLAQLEPVEPKKPSRFTSFWKKTGRVLKKPFKL